MRRILAGALVMLFFAAHLTFNASAQAIKPVFTSTSFDGQLIGLETGDLAFGLWKPIVAFAFPMDFSFRVIRFRAGLGINAGYELPVLKQRIGDPSLAYVNWFSSPVLGREGQTGLEMGMTFGNTRYTGFVGQLWPLEGESRSPNVAFLASEAFHSLDLPYEWRLSASADQVMGLLLPQESEDLFNSIENLLDALSAEKLEDPFRSANYSISLSLDGLRLSGRFGTLQNEAALKKFEFVTGVRGISQSLRGHQYWNLTIERVFTMYQTSIPLHLPEQLKSIPGFPQELPVKLEGKLFFQGGSATHYVEPEESGSNSSADPQMFHEHPAAKSDAPAETEMLFSWGISTTLYVYEFSARVELILTQQGETKFSVSF